MPMFDLERDDEHLAQHAALAKRANTIFIASLISILFCCIGGILGAVVTKSAQKDMDAGNLAGAQSKLTFATIIMVLSYVLGIVALFIRLGMRR